MRLPIPRSPKEMRLHWRISAVIFCLSILPGFSQEPGKELSLPDYIAELDRLSAAVDDYHKNPVLIREWRQRMPHQWTVRAGNRSYLVHCEWLTAGLGEFLEKKSDEAGRSIRGRIALLKADAHAVQQAAPDSSKNRKALAVILERQEFQDVHRPTMLDELMQKLAALLTRMLSKIPGYSNFPNISKIVVWALTAIAAVVLAIWIFRSLRRNTRMETIVLQNVVPLSAKPWTIWMADARAAAAKERWRDAVHLSYWAGICFLESNGLWMPDSARTPREYVQLLPSSSTHRSTLSALTGKFEAIWYGDREAGPESFSESLKYLENLGCHSN
jgi:hypothetical protein